MTSLREKMILTGLSAVALVTAGLVASPEADASPLSFLGLLAARGIVVYDADTAVQTGYEICDELDYRDHVDVTIDLYAGTSYFDIPDMDTAAYWVVAAGSELCPEHRYQSQGSAPTSDGPLRRRLV